MTSMSNILLEQPLLILVSTIVVSVVLAWSLSLFRQRSTWQDRNKSVSPGRRQRSYSFTSQGMVLGVFPDHVQNPETIINAAIFFTTTKNTTNTNTTMNEGCPSVEDIAKLVVTPMLSYDRLSHIPCKDDQQLRPSKNTNYTPQDLIRTIPIEIPNEYWNNAQKDNANQEDINDMVYKAIFEHLQDPLTEGRNDLPWWEILVFPVVVPQPNNHVGRLPQSAVVLRIHHSLADGISLVHVFSNIITNLQGEPVQSLLKTTTSKPSSTTTSTSSSKTTTTAATIKKRPPKKTFLQTIWSLLKETIHVLTLAMSPFDDDIVFRKSIHGTMVHSNNRSYVIFPSIPLSFIKDLKNAANMTVNDILMTAVSQAIYDYCQSQNCPLVTDSTTNDNTTQTKKKPIQCRALLPVALPRPPEELQDKSTALRNYWSLVSTDIGIGCGPDILTRLHYIHDRTSEIKASPRALVQLLIQNSLPNVLPIQLSQQTVYDTFCRHSLVFSNVPGPTEPCLFANKIGRGVQMFYANLIPQIGLLSYAGTVYGNFVLDPNVLPDSQTLATFYAAALSQLADRLHVKTPRPPQVIQAAHDAKKLLAQATNVPTNET